MHNAVIHACDTVPDGRKRPPGALSRWSCLLFGIFLVWLFMFVIAPALEKSPLVKPLADFIEESGIDASALYYTEVEEASVAELNMRHTMEYGPGGGAVLSENICRN